MAGMLETLKSPRDIASLPLDRLEALAEEVRLALPSRFALRDVEARSAAGLCELTIALHKVFDFSHDRLVFDLGYQAAAHHLVCGAAVDQHSRGAPARFDVASPYLEFLPHQPGSSISKVLGLAEGGMQGKNIAVIGDGAIASGEAMEALNAGGAMNSNALVILNDNEMSISRVMGGMGEYLSRIRVGSTYNQLKKDMHRLIKAIPVVGQRLDRAAEQLKGAVASALVPGHLFETLGARYFGPVDGHHIGHIIQLLEEIQRQEGFFLLHLVTRREESPVIKIPDPEPTAEEIADPAPLLVHSLEGESRFVVALAEPLLELARADERVSLVAVSPRELNEQNQLTQAFESQFPDRVWRADVGEMHGTSFAAGMARAGRRPILMAPAAAMARAHGEIIESIALDDVPVVLLATASGVVDECSGAEHGVHDLSFMGGLPRVDIASPRDAVEAGDLLTCLIEADRPAYLRLPPGFSTDPSRCFPTRNEVARGIGEVLRQGTDIAIWALGSTVYPAMEAAECLAESGIEATVVNTRYMRPIDHALLTSHLSDHTVLFTVEEHTLHGGLAATVLEVAARDRLGAGSVLPIALRDDPLGRGARPTLLKSLGMDAAGLTDRMLVEYRRFVRSGSR